MADHDPPRPSGPDDPDWILYRHFNKRFLVGDRLRLSDHSKEWRIDADGRPYYLDGNCDPVFGWAEDGGRICGFLEKRPGPSRRPRRRDRRIRPDSSRLVPSRPSRCIPGARCRVAPVLPLAPPLDRVAAPTGGQPLEDWLSRRGLWRTRWYRNAKADAGTLRWVAKRLEESPPPTLARALREAAARNPSQSNFPPLCGSNVREALQELLELG